MKFNKKQWLEKTAQQTPMPDQTTTTTVQFRDVSQLQNAYNLTKTPIAAIAQAAATIKNAQSVDDLINILSGIRDQTNQFETNNQKLIPIDISQAVMQAIFGDNSGLSQILNNIEITYANYSKTFGNMATPS